MTIEIERDADPLRPAARSLVCGIAVAALAASGCAAHPTRTIVTADHGTSPPPTAARPPRPVPAGALETLAPVWRIETDTQNALAVSGGMLIESGWEGLRMRRLQDGGEAARVTGRTPFWATIAEAGAHTVTDLGEFFLAVGRAGNLARFAPGEPQPRWLVDGCRQILAVDRVGERLYVLCAEPYGATRILAVHAETGAVSFTSAGPSGQRDPGLCAWPSGAFVARRDDTLVGYDGQRHERWRRVIPSSFGLVCSGVKMVVAPTPAPPPMPGSQGESSNMPSAIETALVAIHQKGLEELDGSTGATTRSWAVPEVVASADLFTSSLGALKVVEDVAFIEASATLHAVPLEGAIPRWRGPGVGALVGEGAVYVCSGGRLRALDRASGEERWSYSLSGCRTVGLSGTRVVVGYEAAGAEMTAAGAVSMSGIIAFDRHEQVTACERARIHGVVQVNGRRAPSIGVTAGQDWAPVGDGSVVHWTTEPLPPGGRPARAVHAQTDAQGAFALEVCDRGVVPIVVDYAAVTRFGGRPRATGVVRHVWLEGKGEYAVDFAVAVHEPEL